MVTVDGSLLLAGTSEKTCSNSLLDRKPCVLDHDAECGKNLLDAFTRAVADVKLTAASTTSYKRGASDFSSQIARMTCDKFPGSPNSQP